MAIGDIRAGYMGSLDLGTAGVIRFTSGSIYAKQEVEAPDLIMGTWNRNAAVFGKVEIVGNFSGPVTENFGTLWAAAFDRDSCGNLSFFDCGIRYFCDDTGKTFSVIVNNLTFSCSAGDIAQFSLDLIGAEIPTGGGPGDNTTEEKLITWDVLAVYGFGSKISNFEVSINNNVEAVYAIKEPGATNNYFPFDLVAGLRSISGSVSAYCNSTTELDALGGGKDSYSDMAAGLGDAAIISFFNGSETIEVKVLKHRFEPQAATGPFVATVGFTGVGNQPGD